MNPRVIATKVILDVLQKKSFLTYSLQNSSEKISDQSQRSLIQEICYGVCRWHEQLDFLAKQLLEKPLKQKDQNVYVLILIGLYELRYMRTPDHAVINETVNAVNDLKKPWAKSLVNAVLRNYLRQKDKLDLLVEDDIVAKYSHPLWIIEKLQKYYPDAWQQVLEANNQYPPMSLRVNLSKASREDYVKKVSSFPRRRESRNQNKRLDPRLRGDDSTICFLPQTGIILTNPCDITKLPGFNKGEVSVQDCGAQFAAELLDLKPEQRVLDACAAPGGKTMHILETQANIKELIAIDNNEKRLPMVKANLDRLGKLSCQVNLIAADASQLKSWWDNKKFDRILLDAPCSATGVMRRHPDIKVLREESEINILAAGQLKLLKAMWQLLESDGKLVYITCSVLPEENDQVIEKFLAQTSNAQIQEVKADWGTKTKYGRQILPGQDNMDGFYYAVLATTGPF